MHHHNLAKKHFILFLVLIFVFGCSIGDLNRRESPSKPKQTRNNEVEKPNQPLGNTGNVQTELVGKWCYLANFQANDGGRMSERCFVLNANGTYQYHSETTNSNPYGGSSSESYDSGRWSATATTINAQSESGQTYNYTLEKRNHPKTGDPMLIVDGDAFVTYNRRQPW